MALIKALKIVGGITQEQDVTDTIEFGGIGLGTAPGAGNIVTSLGFVVTTAGNITKINNVATSFPAAQGAASTVLTNDGSGNLSWAAASGGGPWTESGTVVSLVTPTNTVTLNSSLLVEDATVPTPTGESSYVDPYQIRWTDGVVLDAVDVNGFSVGDGSQIGNVGAGVVSIKDNGTDHRLRLSIAAGNAVLRAENSSTSVPIDLDVQIAALNINSNPGSAGQVLTSNGAGGAPTWTTLPTPPSSPWQETGGSPNTISPVTPSSIIDMSGATLAQPLTFDATAGNSVIKTADGSSNRLTVAGGSNTSGGTGGEARLEGGTSTGTGGPAYVYGGGMGVASVGGAVGMYAGNGTGAGGNAALWSGAGVGGGNATSGGIDLFAQSPANNGTGGSITVHTGGAATQSGGIDIYTGDANIAGSIRILTASGYGGGFAKNSTIEVGYGGATAEVRIGQNSDQSRVNVYGAIAPSQRVFGAIANANSDDNPPYLQLGRANANRISGSSNVDGIVVDEYSAPNTRWLAGSSVTLIFLSAMTVRHNIAPPNATIASIRLAGSVDFAAVADSVLGLVYDGTVWQETFRKVA